MKLCRKCSLWKPLEDFYRLSHTRDGRASYCKVCHNAGVLARRRSDREAYRARMRAYRRRPEVREQRADAQRLRRFRKRMARKHGA